MGAGAFETIIIPLDVLDMGRDYVAEIIRDNGKNDLETERPQVTAGQTGTVSSAENGGAAVLLCPASQGSCLDDAVLTRVEVRTDDSVFEPGSSPSVQVSLENDSQSQLERVRAALTAPEGWDVRAGSPFPPALPSDGDAIATWTVRVPNGAAPGSRHDLRAEVSYNSGTGEVDRTGIRQVQVQPHEPPRSSADLSDLDAVDSFNWVRPVEEDMSNGGSAAGDSGPIRTDGEDCEKGLGGHAHSEQVYDLGERCDQFSATVGVDDTAGERVSVVFQMWGDGRLLHDGGLLTGSSPGSPVDVADEENLRLMLADSGDFVPDDLGDRGGARVTCG